jgi:hypothetical protein
MPGRRARRFAAAGVALALVAACGTAPLSSLDGRPPHVLPPEHYPVHILSVDGMLQFNQPIQVAPGPRFIVAEALGGRSARGALQKSFVFKVEPCTHYYFAAARKSPMDADWDLVVQHRDPVAGCNPEDEVKKAKAAGLPV